MNDLRALPMMAAVNIARRFSKRSDTFLMVSNRSLASSDYGQHLPAIYKKLKVKIASLFVRIIYITPNYASSLSEAELKGVVSSLQSITCDSKASRESYPELFRLLSEVALGAKDVFDYIARSKPVARVFVFNGRTASSHPVVIGCHNLAIKVSYYEFGYNSYSGYRLYPYPPHSTKLLGEDLCRFRKICLKSVPDIYLKGKRWGADKLKNVYTKQYLETTEAKYDIAIFLGSEHEYSNIEEEICGFKFIGNLGLISAVINKYGLGKKIAVRAHPNQATDRNYKITLEPIISLCEKNGFMFYGPESKISSYELIKNSSVVAVEFSSIGHDAVLLGKQVDVIGDLDLKVILSKIDHDRLSDRDYIAAYTREVLALYEDIFFVKFNLYEAFVSRALTVLEWRVMRSSVVPSSLLTIHEA